MKKLMIAAAIVCAAAMSHAASMCWGFKNAEIKDVDGAYFGEGSRTDATAFLISGTVTASDSGWVLAQDAEILGYATMDPSAYNWGYFKDSTTTGMPTVDAVAGDPVSLILLDGVVANSLDAFKSYEGNYIMSDKTAFTQESIAGTTPVPYLAAIDNKSYGAGDWSATPQGVPEPTSGLLLLLGVAGLALRRRRA